MSLAQSEHQLKEIELKENKKDRSERNTSTYFNLTEEEELRTQNELDKMFS